VQAFAPHAVPAATPSAVGRHGDRPYAAASIDGSPPLTRAVYTLRNGPVKFVIPFVFAYYPFLLLVKESGVVLDWFSFLSIVARLLVFIYLLSSALIAFDSQPLTILDIVVRVILGLLMLYVAARIHWPATFVALAYLIWHRARLSKSKA
jgi:TRAP-type uncharacterized transport system fused permease subunit